MRFQQIIFTALLVTVQGVAAVRPASSDLLPVTSGSPQARKLFEQGMANLETMHPERALSDFQSAVQKNRNFAQALIMVAYLTRDPGEEVASFTKAKHLMPYVSPGERLLVRWLSGVREDEYLPAIGAMNDLLTLYSSDPRVMFLAGNWLLRQQRYEQAEFVLETGIALHPNYSPIIDQLARAYAFNGNFKKAFSLMDRYMELQPKQPAVHDCYAEISRMAGDFQGALAHYGEALKLDRQFISSQVGIADTYALMGDQQRARQEYAKALNIPDSENDRFEIEMQSATTFVREHRFVEADQAFRAVADGAHKAGNSFVEAEALCAMAMYEPRFATAAQDLEKASLAVNQTAVMSKSALNEERARILEIQAIRAVHSGMDEVATKVLGELASAADTSHSAAIARFSDAAQGAFLMQHAEYAKAIPHLEGDVSNPLSLELLWQAFDKTGAKAESQALVSRMAVLNRPTVEQALTQPEFRVSLNRAVQQP